MPELSDRNPDVHPEESLSIRWKSVAIGSIIVAIASLAATAVISSIREADALSVVALALAVLAFVVQIIVYIVQAAGASRQEVHMTEVYERTLKALNSIEEKSEGTRQTVTSISDRLLDAAIGKAIPEAQASGIGAFSTELSDDVSRRVIQLMAGAERSSTSRHVERGRIRRPTTSVIGSRTDESMRQLPPENRMAQAIATLEKLSASELYALYQLGDDQSRNGGQASTAFGPGLRIINPYSAPKLVESGLVVRRRVSWSNAPVFQLSDEGKDAARILLSPEQAATSSDAAKTIAHRLDVYQKKLNTRADPSEMYRDIPILND